MGAFDALIPPLSTMSGASWADVNDFLVMLYPFLNAQTVPMWDSTR
jgi:hypothetical protein